MRHFSAIIIVILVLAPLACSPQPVDMAALRKTVDEYNNASKEEMLTGNSDKAKGYYESDALELAPNLPMIKGRDNIIATHQQMLKAGMKFSNVSLQTLELTADGKIAVEIGSYEMMVTMPSIGEMKDSGKYITIWRQQSDGSWKVHAGTYNTSNPLPTPPEEKGKKK